MQDAHLDKSKGVDTLMVVDMKGQELFKLFKRTRELGVEFRERCARVCNAGRRQAALRERALLQAWRYGGRI
jgi:hypothetical protein